MSTNDDTLVVTNHNVKLDNPGQLTSSDDNIKFFDLDAAKEKAQIEGNYHDVEAEQVLEYRLTWDHPFELFVQCFVALGTCEMTQGGTEQETIVTWSAPAESGHHEVKIIYGDAYSTTTYYDRIQVIE